jgi:Domain of unknown function (DUF1992)
VGGYETWIDRQIREAQERGAFDNLPGAGKPIQGLDGRRDDDWWAKDLIRREKLTMPLPTSLALRKEVEDLPETLADERSEDVVRALVDDLNGRILDARRRVVTGPPVVVRTVDVDSALLAWKERRARVDESRRAAVAEHRQRRQASGA